MDKPPTFAFEIDPAIVSRLKRGDLAALEHIYRAFEHATYNLALRLTARPDVAGDVMQNAMLKAFEHARQYRGDAPFGAWLKRLVVNEALMHLRREHRHRTEAFEDVYPDEHGAQPWLLADAATLKRALAQLPDTARVVLWLYHVEGYTHVEIAAQFGRTTSFSKSQLARGIRRLRELLDPTVEEAPCLTGTTTTA